jgi:hypothetical protein
VFVLWLYSDIIIIIVARRRIGGPDYKYNNLLNANRHVTVLILTDPHVFDYSPPPHTHGPALKPNTHMLIIIVAINPPLHFIHLSAALPNTATIRVREHVPNRPTPP